MLLLTAALFSAAAAADCDVFLSASTLPAAGTGVFAGRDFAAGDIVERLPAGTPVHQSCPPAEH